MKLFIRQPFTESRETERRVIQSAMDVIAAAATELGAELLTDTEAQTEMTFRQRFEQLVHRPFTPVEFRNWRLSLLAQADAMIIIRTGLSESSAFEVAYNIYGGRRVPMLFCVWNPAPIKTTLLSDLSDICPVEYVGFAEAMELGQPVRKFLYSLKPGDMTAL